MAHILTIVGARPQFVKAAVVSHALADSGVKETIIHTGQHFDASMSDIFFGELGIPAPTYNLAVNSMGHGAMTGRMLERIEEVLQIEKPDLVLVYGDTNSTLAGALAASKLHLPVAHVEAGLRSFNKLMPEELNRVVTDHLSDVLFCPTITSVENLQREGINRQIHMVGDVMYDATISAVKRAEDRPNFAERLGLGSCDYAVATIHRAENTDDAHRFTQILDWLAIKAAEQPIVLPVHPRTRTLLAKQSPLHKNILLIDPLGYLDMAILLSKSSAVFTDSGGLQKEAYFHRVPCVTLRDETEWVETIEAGWNRLWINDTYKPRRDIDDYGSGHASSAIVSILKDYLSG